MESTTIKAISLRRLSKDGVEEWLICTGVGMGRWSSWFGPWCLAACDADASEFVRTNKSFYPDAEVVEFEIKQVTAHGK